MEIQRTHDIEKWLFDEIRINLGREAREHIHLTDLLAPRKAYFQRVRPQYPTDDEIMYWLTGRGHEDALRILSNMGYISRQTGAWNDIYYSIDFFCPDIPINCPYCNSTLEWADYRPQFESANPQLSYIAGVIDGEGSIQVLKHKRRNPNWHPYEVQLSITVSDDLFFQKIAENLSPFIGRTPVKNFVPKIPHNGKKYCRIITLPKKDLKKLLPRLIPYLTCKRRQAILALEAIFIIDSASHKNFYGGKKQFSEYDLNRLEAIVEEMHGLNKRSNEIKPRPPSYWTRLETLCQKCGHIIKPDWVITELKTRRRMISEEGKEEEEYEYYLKQLRGYCAILKKTRGWLWIWSLVEKQEDGSTRPELACYNVTFSIEELKQYELDLINIKTALEKALQGGGNHLSLPECPAWMCGKKKKIMVEKPFCETCKRIFDTEWGINKHINSKTGEGHSIRMPQYETQFEIKCKWYEECKGRGK